jgi:hypothetical protein
MPVFQVNLSYPKPRALQTKFGLITRTDSATPKMVLPKGSIPWSVEFLQTSAAVTDVGGVDIGWTGDADALVDGQVFGTTLTGSGPATGVIAGLSLGQPLAADTVITATYVVGSSTAGGAATFAIHYFMPGPGEGIDA